MKPILFFPCVAVVTFSSCAAPKFATTQESPLEATLAITVPTNEEVAERGADFLVFYADMVDALATESDDIPTLARIIEYRIAQSKQFMRHVDLIARAISKRQLNDGKVPALAFYQTTERVRQTTLEGLRAKLPSDILEAKMKKKKEPNQTPEPTAPSGRGSP